MENEGASFFESKVRYSPNLIQCFGPSSHWGPCAALSTLLWSLRAYLQCFPLLCVDKKLVDKAGGCSNLSPQPLLVWVLVIFLRT